MERPIKKVKTHGFQSDQEAQTYIDYALRGGIPDRNVWILILSNNPELSVQDISRMCRVNSFFKSLCDSGEVWDKIFVRQFGTETLDQARKMFPQEPLLRLMTWRVWLDTADCIPVQVRKNRTLRV